LLKRGDCCDTCVTFACVDWCLEVVAVMTDFIAHSLVVCLLDHVEDFLLDMGVKDFLFDMGAKDFLFDMVWRFFAKYTRYCGNYVFYKIQGIM
jgi:hypothetical protein